MARYGKEKVTEFIDCILKIDTLIDPAKAWENKTIKDPNKHVVEHVYAEPGEYKPFILDTFQSQNVKKVFLQESLIVG